MEDGIADPREALGAEAVGGIVTLRLHCHKLAPQLTRGITEHMTTLGYVWGAEMAWLVLLGRSTQ